VVKVARKIRLKDEGKDVAYWLSRPPTERLRALAKMRRMYVKAYVAPGKQRLQRVYRIVKLDWNKADIKPAQATRSKSVRTGKIVKQKTTNNNA